MKRWARRSHLILGTLSIVVCLTLIGCSHGQVKKPADGPTTTAVPPGSSRTKESSPQKQVITLVQLTQVRSGGEQLFVAGSGYADIDGGGRHFAGLNRSLDPYLEVTIRAVDTPAFAECRKLLEQRSLSQRAVAISGKGYFTSGPGIRERQLGVFRLDTLSGCKLVPRR